MTDKDNDILSLLDVGLSEYGLGRIKEAVDVWRKVLMQDPNNARAMEYIRFVEQNWAPQKSTAPVPKPYRPDEGAQSVSPGWVKASAEQEAEQSSQASAPVAAAPVAEDFSAPPAPLVDANQWGELFDAKLSVEPDAVPTAGKVDIEINLPPEPVMLQDIDLDIETGDTKLPQESPVPAESFPVPRLPVHPTRSDAEQEQSQGVSLDVLDLVNEPTPEPQPALVIDGADAKGHEIATLLSGIRSLLELDDFSGAKELLEKVLELEPTHREAAEQLAGAERKLIFIYSSKLGELSQVPKICMAEDEVIWLNLDHRAGFVMSLVDGNFSYDDIVSVSGIEEVEALKILAQLLQEKVISTS